MPVRSSDHESRNAAVNTNNAVRARIGDNGAVQIVAALELRRYTHIVQGGDTCGVDCGNSQEPSQTRRCCIVIDGCAIVLGCSTTKDRCLSV